MFSVVSPMTIVDRSVLFVMDFPDWMVSFRWLKGHVFCNLTFSLFRSSKQKIRSSPVSVPHTWRRFWADMVPFKDTLLAY